MIYTFNVLSGYLNCTNARKTIISDMVNVHVAKFTLDSSWLGYDKTATFENTKTNVKKDIVLGTETLECLIPWESLVAESEGGYLVVSLTGYKDGKILRTKMFNPLLIEKSDIDDGDNPLPPTPDVYEQIMDLIASLGGAYTLPIASSTTLGGIKVGTNLSIDVNGVLNAESGGTNDYSLLINKPSVNGVTLSGNKTSSDLGINVPTKTSDITNDSGFITNSVNDLTNYTKTSSLSTVATSGSYMDLLNKPSIPTKTSDLSNDSGFLTSIPIGTNSVKGIIQADGTTTTKGIVLQSEAQADSVATTASGVVAYLVGVVSKMTT